MAVFLLNANHDILSATGGVLCFPDGEIDGLAFVMAVAHDTAVFIHYIPAI